MGSHRKTRAERKAFELHIPKTVYWACGFHPKGHRRRNKAEFCKEKHLRKAQKAANLALAVSAMKARKDIDEILTPPEFQSVGFGLAEIRRRLDERLHDTAAL